MPRGSRQLHRPVAIRERTRLAVVELSFPDREDLLEDLLMYCDETGWFSCVSPAPERLPHVQYLVLAFFCCSGINRLRP